MFGWPRIACGCVIFLAIAQRFGGRNVAERRASYTFLGFWLSIMFSLVALVGSAVRLAVGTPNPIPGSSDDRGLLQPCGQQSPGTAQVLLVVVVTTPRVLPAAQPAIEKSKPAPTLGLFLSCWRADAHDPSYQPCLENAPIGRVTHQTVEFHLCNKVGVINDFTKNEQILLRRHYAIKRNAIWRDTKSSTNGRY